MRRFFSILLLVVFGLTFTAPLLALSGLETSLPACCRRLGRHRCAGDGSMGSMDTMSGKDSKMRGAQLRAPMPKCRYSQALFSSVHSDPFTLPVAEASFAGVVSHPAVTAQMESKWRVARERSRGKRGPPSKAITA